MTGTRRNYIMQTLYRLACPGAFGINLGYILLWVRSECDGSECGASGSRVIVVGNSEGIASEDGVSKGGASDSRANEVERSEENE